MVKSETRPIRSQETQTPWHEAQVSSGDGRSKARLSRARVCFKARAGRAGATPAGPRVTHGSFALL